MLPSSHQTKTCIKYFRELRSNPGQVSTLRHSEKNINYSPTFSGSRWTKLSHSNKRKCSRTVCVGRSQSLAFSRGGFLCVVLCDQHCICSQCVGALIPLTYMHLKGAMREINVGGKFLFYSLVIGIISIIWILYGYYKYYKYFSSHFSISKAQGQFYGSTINNSKGYYILFVSNPSFYLL